MIYQLVNKRTEILPLATSHIAHLCNYVFALLISMPHFKSINFYQNRLKIKLFLKKNTKFSIAGVSTPRPRASGSWKLCPQTHNVLTLPKQPPIADFLLRACATRFAATSKSENALKTLSPSNKTNAEHSCGFYKSSVRLGHHSG